jgi:hypothetical protein
MPLLVEGRGRAGIADMALADPIGCDDDKGFTGFAVELDK